MQNSFNVTVSFEIIVGNGYGTGEKETVKNFGEQCLAVSLVKEI